MEKSIYKRYFYYNLWPDHVPPLRCHYSIKYNIFSYVIECSKLSTHCPLPVTEAANRGVLEEKMFLSGHCT